MVRSGTFWALSNAAERQTAQKNTSAQNALVASFAGSADPALGLQAAMVGSTQLFVVPNPSPANAHFTPADQTIWYDALAEALSKLRD